MLVIAIVGVVLALSVPATRDWSEGTKGRRAARAIADAFTLARGQAIKTGHNHMIFFSSGAGVDAAPAGLDVSSNPLLDPNDNPVPILVLDDGSPGDGSQDCEIDSGEPSSVFAAEDGVVWGPTSAPMSSTAPEDSGSSIPSNGITFVDPVGNPVTWVLFRPDGIPVSVGASCNQGRLGSGGGTVYVSNAERDFAVTLSPLGGVHVHTWNPAAGAWSQ
jgi:hypothetical protein